MISSCVVFGALQLHQSHSCNLNSIDRHMICLWCACIVLHRCTHAICNSIDRLVKQAKNAEKQKLMEELGEEGYAQMLAEKEGAEGEGGGGGKVGAALEGGNGGIGPRRRRHPGWHCNLEDGGQNAVVRRAIPDRCACSRRPDQEASEVPRRRCDRVGRTTEASTRA